MQMQIGRFVIDPQQRAAFLEFARDMAGRYSSEPGCVCFEISEDIQVHNRFLVIEEWDNDELLSAHLSQPHVDQDEETLARFIVGEPAWDEFEF